jgi:PRTRC genetic system protein B
MKVNLQIGGTATFNLTTALLVYEKKRPESSSYAYDFKGEAAVTIHPVLSQSGRPTLGPGQPVTMAAVESLTSALGQKLGAAWLPPEVLSVSFGKIVWWQPATRARIWFKVHKDKNTRQLNGKFAWHPPLLFSANGRTLRIFALTQNRRPGANTKVYTAPYWNLSVDGTMCNGNANIPDQPAVAHIPDFAAAFFNSAFTHSNMNRLCAHPQGHHGLWTDLILRKAAPNPEFWTRFLLPRKQTVNQLITCQ